MNLYLKIISLGSPDIFYTTLSYKLYADIPGRLAVGDLFLIRWFIEDTAFDDNLFSNNLIAERNSEI